MTDHFVVLSEPRRPWLEVEPLKAKFLTLSGKAHPDRAKDHREREAAVHRFAEINAAYNCLRDTKERLHHLYVIETGNEARQVRQGPPAIGDLIIPAQQIFPRGRRFLHEQ